MKRLLNFITFRFNMVGKTVIHFTTHGSMGESHEFDWIGKIVEVDINFGDWYYNKVGYKVQILKDKNGYELRNNKDEVRYKKVASWYLQKLDGDFFCVYD